MLTIILEISQTTNVSCCLFVVVITLTHRHNTMQSVVAGQAPTTLEWKKYLGSKNRGKNKKTSIRIPPPGKQKGDF